MDPEKKWRKIEPGLYELPAGKDGKPRYAAEWLFRGRKVRRRFRTVTLARQSLYAVRGQIVEGRYIDRRKEAPTVKFEEAVKRFLEWSEVNTRPSSHKNDRMNAPLWTASPYFAGKSLSQITPTDIERFRLERLRDVDRRGPSLSGLLLLAGKLYHDRTGKTLKGDRRELARLALGDLLKQYSGTRIKEALAWYFQRPGAPNLARLGQELAARARTPEPARRGRPLTKRTVDVSLARLKKLFSLAVEWGLVDKSPAAKVKLLREDERRTRYLTEEEEARLLAVAPPSLARVVRFALATGMRRGEILGLRWQDVDFRNAVAVIPAARAKGKRDRPVPLNAVALALVNELPRCLDRSAPVFGNSKGNTNENLEREWRRTLALSGVEDFRFHDLRHTYASRLVMRGVDLAVLRELLGHRDFETTLRYAHLGPSRLRDAVALLEPLAEKQIGKLSVNIFPQSEEAPQRQREQLNEK